MRVVKEYGNGEITTIVGPEILEGNVRSEVEREEEEKVKEWHRRAPGQT